MNLFIQVENGHTINHPAFEDNLIQAFGHVPGNWEPFVRVQCPPVGIYQILESEIPLYQKINNVWTDVWALRNMSTEEKTSKQNQVKSDWNNVGFHSWTFNEDTCSFTPPIPYPTDGERYTWNESLLNWVRAN